MSSQDWARFLCASPHRLEILQHLAKTSADTRGITQISSGSRPSVQRHLRGFVEREWTRKFNGEYHLTSTGKRVADQANKFITGLELVENHRDFFRHLAEFEQPFRTRFLADAQVVAANECYPHAPVEHFVRCLRQQSTEMIVGICPIRSQLFDKACVDLLDEGVHIEVIVPEAIFNRKQTGQSSAFELTDGGSEFEVNIYDGSINFGLAITDKKVYIGAYERGHFKVNVESGSVRVREWAQKTYSIYRKQSRPLTDADFN